jgi:hypothetical protein
MNELKAGWSRILEKIRACPAEALSVLKIILTGLLLLILSYPLTFTTRSFTIYGRGTRVHFAAVVGFSLLWTTVILVLLQISDTMGKRRLVSTLLAVILGLWLSFSIDVQRDYTVAWELQQEFWGELVPLIEDVDEGDAILINPAGLADTTHIDANTWNLPRILNQIFIFPDDWEAVPRVYRLVPGWERSLLNQAGDFELFNLTVDAPPSTYGSIESENVILIESIGPQLIRSSEMSVAGEKYALKQESAGGLFDLRKGFLFGLLILDEEEDPGG